MKVFTTIMKIVAAVAVIAGIVFVFVAYGDKIVAWSKKILAKFHLYRKDDDYEELPDFED